MSLWQLLAHNELTTSHLHPCIVLHGSLNALDLFLIPNVTRRTFALQDYMMYTLDTSTHIHPLSRTTECTSSIQMAHLRRCPTSACHQMTSMRSLPPHATPALTMSMAWQTWWDSLASFSSDSVVLCHKWCQTSVESKVAEFLLGFNGPHRSPLTDLPFEFPTHLPHISFVWLAVEFVMSSVSCCPGGWVHGCSLLWRGDDSSSTVYHSSQPEWHWDAWHCEAAPEDSSYYVLWRQKTVCHADSGVRWRVSSLACLVQNLQCFCPPSLPLPKAWMQANSYMIYHASNWNDFIRLLIDAWCLANARALRS